jgi:hypothetical protein
MLLIELGATTDDMLDMAWSQEEDLDPPFASEAWEEVA